MMESCLSAVGQLAASNKIILLQHIVVSLKVSSQTGSNTVVSPFYKKDNLKFFWYSKQIS